MANYECPCGGGFPHPVKWQGNWVCPWCYDRFMKFHSNEQYSHSVAGVDWDD